MEDFPSNSHKSKEQEKASEKKIEKAISGTAKTRKRSEMRKFADVFLPGDVQNVKSYILADVLVPSIKKAISDIVTNGIDMILYGESGNRDRRSTASKVSYRSYYEKKNETRVDRSTINHTRGGYSYEDIVFETRGDAESVLSRMDEIVEKYNIVSVADMYELADISGSYTDNKYGWTDIRNAQVVRIRDGYVIKMPRPMPLD